MAEGLKNYLQLCDNEQFLYINILKNQCASARVNVSFKLLVAIINSYFQIFNIGSSVIDS
jgi:hypothetical protein